MDVPNTIARGLIVVIPRMDVYALYCGTVKEVMVKDNYFFILWNILNL